MKTGHPTLQIGHPVHRLEREAQGIRDLQRNMATDYMLMFDNKLSLIATYAMMKAKGMPPVNAKLHPEKHFAHDYEYTWPLALGTSLNDIQYAAVEQILRQPQVAKQCFCGNSIAYGSGSGDGAKYEDGVTGFFCGDVCHTEHVRQQANINAEALERDENARNNSGSGAL